MGSGLKGKGKIVAERVAENAIGTEGQSKCNDESDWIAADVARGTTKKGSRIAEVVTGKRARRKRTHLAGKSETAATGTRNAVEIEKRRRGRKIKKGKIRKTTARKRGTRRTRSWRKAKEKTEET